ncbi:kinase-like protein [Obba rivulosa]|uniref:non-specific serine/threonine protein kinase n=1 Tax=Obba rivulosa TaxID=1052685 RepID=A0A8E2DS71_9APHY|nr:kinase-like protein [Obba rivulosa]
MLVSRNISSRLPAAKQPAPARLLRPSCYQLRRRSLSTHESAPNIFWPSNYNLKTFEWPEENLGITIAERGGFYPARLGETFEQGRFVITRKLGWGGFSSVWLAKDQKLQKSVAIKMLTAFGSREIQLGRMKEMEMLKKIASANPSHPGFRHVGKLLHDFEFNSFAGTHVCAVTDVLSFDVPGLLIHSNESRLPLKLVLKLVRDTLKGLSYLHDECKIIHTDLKPDNILLKPTDVEATVMRELSENPSKLWYINKDIAPDELPFHPVAAAPIHFTPDFDGDVGLSWVISDFGHARPHIPDQGGIVQPYALRAPEVIFGLPWGPPIDIWSLGCLMFELATGQWLFSPDVPTDLPREVVHLSQMAQRMQDAHELAPLRRYGKLIGVEDIEKLVNHAIPGVRPIQTMESDMEKYAKDHNGDSLMLGYTKLMRSFLTLDPSRRPRAEEALRDPLLTSL